MNHRLIHHMVLIGSACLAFASICAPARAQMIVYDPSNYAQNVLQAARALQQINNQITSLQNQTQMLLNQAKNLANLPYSSLRTIVQSLERMQQLLNEAQRVAYDVNQIDQAFQRLYPQGYTGTTSSQQLISDAKERWQNFAGCLSGCDEGASRCGGEPRHYAYRDRRTRLLEPVSRGRSAGRPGWQPAGRTADQTTRRSHCSRCGAITGA
jgi:conjugal transfer/entry exclusion protein